MVYGYCRVSAKSQQDNNSFEQQEQEIHSRYPDAKMYYEQFTGTTTHRPIVFQNSIEKARTNIYTHITRSRQKMLAKGLENTFSI